jgi:hypothetical protein
MYLGNWHHTKPAWHNLGVMRHWVGCRCPAVQTTSTAQSLAATQHADAMPDAICRRLLFIALPAEPGANLGPVQGDVSQVQHQLQSNARTQRATRQQHQQQRGDVWAQRQPQLQQEPGRRCC